MKLSIKKYRSKRRSSVKRRSSKRRSSVKRHSVKKHSVKRRSRKRGGNGENSLISSISSFVKYVFKHACSQKCSLAMCGVMQSLDSEKQKVLTDLLNLKSVEWDTVESKDCHVIFDTTIHDIKLHKDEELNETDSYAKQSKAHEIVEKTIDFMIEMGLLERTKVINKVSSFESINAPRQSRLSVQNRGRSSISSGRNVSIFSDDSTGMGSTMSLFKENVVTWKGRLIWNDIHDLSFEECPEAFKNLRNSGLDDETIVILIQLIFWYFRKIIVDFTIRNLCYDIFEEDRIVAVSAGSVKLTSDYDISLYNASDMFFTARFFNEEIKDVFGNAPSIVFDSNVYTSAFATLVKPREEKYNYYTGTNDLWYVDFQKAPGQDEIVGDQHVWALLKMMNYFQNEQVGIQNSMTQVYSSLLNLYKTLINSDTADNVKLSHSSATPTLREYMNALSFDCAKSSEAYFTRGAFIDVVVNGQMGANSIPLCDDALLDSIAENMTDNEMHHGKPKYHVRFNAAFNKLKVKHTKGALNIPLVFKFLLSKISMDNIEHVRLTMIPKVPKLKRNVTTASPFEYQQHKQLSRQPTIKRSHRVESVVEADENYASRRNSSKVDLPTFQFGTPKKSNTPKKLSTPTKPGSPRNFIS